MNIEKCVHFIDKETDFQSRKNALREYKLISATYENSTFSEFGSATGCSFTTSQGVKTMIPGKRYDENLNEIV